MTQACRLVDEGDGVKVSPSTTLGERSGGAGTGEGHRFFDAFQGFVWFSRSSTGVLGMGPPTGRDAPVRVTLVTV